MAERMNSSTDSTEEDELGSKVGRGRCALLRGTSSKRRRELGATRERWRRAPAEDIGGHCRGDGAEREEDIGGVRELREITRNAWSRSEKAEEVEGGRNTRRSAADGTMSRTIASNTEPPGSIFLDEEVRRGEAELRVASA
jgi:hypothetical protein